MTAEPGAAQPPAGAGDPSLDATEHRLEVPRSARYYLAGGEADPREIWVVLHGFGMLAREFLGWFKPAQRPDRLLVAPEALNHYYTDHRARRVGATWMTSEDRQAEIGDYVRYLDLVLTRVRSGLAQPDLRVEVHAFSQGAATGCRWVGLGEARPARLVLWGGGVPPDLDLNLAGSRLSAARLTLVVGDRDEYISEEQVAAEARRLSAAGVRYDLRRFRGGHTIPWPLLQELAGQPGGS